MNNMTDINKKTRVKISVCGTDYNIKSGESIEYVKSLGAEVDRLMFELTSSDPRISTTMAAVLTALTALDDKKKAVETADNLREQLKDYLNDNAKTRAVADELKKENARLQSELDKYRKK